LLLCLLLGGIFFFNRPTEPQYFTTPTTQPLSKTTAVATEEYKSPVDFAALRKESENAYAWLDIPGTEISYPILQHPTDDSYYIHRNLQGDYEYRGVIFTESSYNGRDFSDPLTMVYGHCMKNGDMFGRLQKTYSSAESLAEHSEFVIYLPERELHYTVFAAVPYDSRHILYNYDFTNQRTFRAFFQDILSVRSMQAVFAEDTSVSPDDNVVILSTCLNSNLNNRFLVCGKLVKTVPEDKK